mgnify:FL=1
MASLPPGILLVAGALLVPLFKGRLKQLWLLALPLVAGAHLYALAGTAGAGQQLEFLGHTLTLARVDRLALVFGLAFHVAAFLATVFSLHVKDDVQHVAGLAYAGSAIAAVFAGDLITLFCAWEGTAIASVFLVWATRTERSYRSAMRYLLFQVGSGVLLLAGILFHLRAGGGVGFDALPLDTTGGRLMFAAFGIKACFPLLHTWLVDAYPNATPGGAVWLSAFTTKLAVYALARGFAGAEPLVALGAAMAVFPLFFALVENDLRRVLAYSLISQLGYMVAAVGVGTPLALDGAAAHAFAHILYKALLFMALGAVLHRTGTCRATELGGLARSMPWTAGFCLVAAASIAAVPGFSGFASKSLILDALAAEHRAVAWHLLLFAGAAVVPYLAFRVPYLAFFAPARRAHEGAGEAPATMRVAMAVAAAGCVAVGVFPGALYALLPGRPDVQPYTGAHVVGQLQLLVFAGLATALLFRKGWFPLAREGRLLDFDWTWRRLVPAVGGPLVRAGARLRATVLASFRNVGLGLWGRLFPHLAPSGSLARAWSTGSTVLWVAVILAAYLVLYYLG